jgi:hypothetical protein
MEVWMLRKAGVSLTVLLVALFTALAVGASAQTGNGNEKGNIKGKPRSFLFVENARGGTFTAHGKSGFRLTLHGVDPKVVFFTDRPARDSGLIPQKELLRTLWGPGDAPPNAAVEVLGGSKSSDVLAVKLKNPRYNAHKRTISYDATLLRNLTPGLRHYRGLVDRKLPRRFGDVSLFIDSGDGGNTCDTRIANSADGAMVERSESIWSTDSWEDKQNPSGTGIPNDGNTYSGGVDDGGFARGCSATVTWGMPDGSNITIVTQDPYTGSNTFTCSPSNPSRYRCDLGSNSVIHGLDLIVFWNIHTN